MEKLPKSNIENYSHSNGLSQQGLRVIKHRDYIVVGDKEGRKVATESFTLSGGKISSKEKMETIGAEKGRLIPQEIGVIVTDYLQKNGCILKELVGYWGYRLLRR